MYKAKAVAIACGALVLSMTLTACGATNKGGDTTCGDFKNMSASAQRDAITLLLKERNENPSNGEITLAAGSAKLYCATVGSDDSKIREING